MVAEIKHARKSATTRANVDNDVTWERVRCEDDVQGGAAAMDWEAQRVDDRPNLRNGNQMLESLARNSGNPERGLRGRTRAPKLGSSNHGAVHMLIAESKHMTPATGRQQSVCRPAILRM